MSRGVPDPGEDIARVMALVNTLSGRGSGAPKETLVSGAALIDWARGAGILTASTAADLTRQAGAQPTEAARALERTRALREALHALFAAVAAKRAPSPAVLATLAAHVSPGFEHPRLVFNDGSLRWAPGAVAELDDVPRELARAAASLIGSDCLLRVRACAADDCRWWFIDDTRNHSRRWCEMKTCGNRAKLRRYRSRQ